MAADTIDEVLHHVLDRGVIERVQRHSRTRTLRLHGADGYDELLAEATRQPDPVRRRALLEESERVMLADTPVLPLYFYVNKHLVKPYIRGWHDNVMNVQYSKDLSRLDGK